MEPQQSPFVSLLCPPPANVILTANTFVHFRHQNSVIVGLVLTISPSEMLLSIRLFLTWNDVKERLGALNLPQNISFWPKTPFYLCDTDIVVNNVSLDSIIGLAFVFYDSSPMVRQVIGMKNTNRVTSCVWFSQHIFTHGVTFKPYPSERFQGLLMSCFPSMIMSQLLCVKRELERLMNTRSLSSRNTAVVHINNIDMYTWNYMMKDAPVAIEAKTVVSRAGHVHLNEFIQQSWREPQFSL
jgi:hypothetical protein